MTETQEQFGLCRRALFVGAGGVGAAALLAACGGSDPATPAPETQATTPPAQGGATSAASAVLAKASEVPVGGGKLVGNVLLVQPQAGVIKGFNARCPHMGTTVDEPKGGVITCPNHGSQFKAEDGSLVKGPATKGLSPILLKITGDDIARE
ncbi:Rieske (2Fe-2S) protein [Longispora sp. NPDC051575]|uniref:Rieske (2Fe-2S) protein n=1 Tax=Longispora sp. NPDC051575 TaxID=3154943 RepID=UPI003420459B